MSIPKILHFTWKSRELPAEMARLFAKWQAMHPKWDIRFYTDEDMRAFMVAHFPNYVELFDGYPKQIQRVDAFRYFVLSRIGGVYADLDVDPYRSIDELSDAVDCFVGVEPESHSRNAPDGIPYTLCNALMGSVPGHRFWDEVFVNLARSKDTATVTSTGPRMMNGAGVQAPRAHRPVALSPGYWSPRDFYGGKADPSPQFLAQLEEQFEVFGADRAAVCSHLWHATWFLGPLQKLLVDRVKGPERQWYNIHNRIKWALRRRRFAAIESAAQRFPAIEQTYGDQVLRPFAANELPVVTVAVSLSSSGLGLGALQNALGRLDYPCEKLRLTLAMGSNGSEASASELAGQLAGSFKNVEVCVLEPGQSGAADMHNRLARDAMERSDYCLFVDDRLDDVQPGALMALLSARRKVVAANTGPDGETYLYEDRAFFKTFYRRGGQGGSMERMYQPSVAPLDRLQYLGVAPLDCVGAGWLLVDCEVFRSGVVFPQAPYKLHEDARGMGILAREAGFDVCGMPHVKVSLHPKTREDIE